MKILKYIFLLILLTTITIIVFLATQKGDFSVERSKIIKTPKATVFYYINEYKNWEEFSSWIVDNPDTKVNFGAVTSGINANFSWSNKENKGNIQTLGNTNQDEIRQQLEYDNSLIESKISFKDTIGGTKITWKAKGKMSFYLKIYSALNGGADKIIGTIFEKSLLNLDKILVFETNTYSIKVNGVVKKNEAFYIKQTFTSEIAKVFKNVSVVIPNLTTFCETNGIASNGKPFVIYHTYNPTTGLAKISICLPINKEIFTSSGSDILTGKLAAFEAVKTTLKGDYSHQPEAISKSEKYITIKKLEVDTLWSHLEIYNISKLDIKNPSKWRTTSYFPLKTKIIVAPKLIHMPNTAPVTIPSNINSKDTEQDTSEF